MSTEPTPPFRSAYPELKLPADGWKSTLPEHLLDGADPQTLWIMHEISKNTQATEFACWAVVEQNAHLRTLNGRTSKSEKGIEEAREKLDGLGKKAEIMEPLFKPLSQFMGLWDYKVFRWGCYIVGFFLLTYALPAYMKHPVSIETLFTLLFK